ncbi:MAG: adenylate kinase [Candidatus Omnitrophica bacterium]|nr:adenylate kinase [Candidatus Omnitrophota bacterium]
MNVVLLGPPGAGKGTQAQVLSTYFNIPHISTGDMLRGAVKEGSEVGRLAKSYMDRGELVPDEVVVNIVKERIAKSDASGGFMLDGFPRNDKQADKLDEALDTDGKKIDVVLYFKTSPETSIDRLSGRRVCAKCGANFHVKNMPPKKDGICDYCGGKLYQRDDDKIDTIKRRLVVYEKETASLIEYYKNKNILSEVSGDLDVDHLFIELKKLLAKPK